MLKALSKALLRDKAIGRCGFCEPKTALPAKSFCIAAEATVYTLSTS